MEKTAVKIKSIQNIDGDVAKEIYDGEIFPLDESQDTLSLTYFDSNKELVSMTIYFYNDAECMIKLIRKEYSAIINMKLDEKTHGKYVINDRTMELEFVLKKFFKKSLDISFEYDIFTMGKIVSSNILEIEVKKC